MAVEAEKRDAVAGLHSCFTKNTSQAARPFCKLRVSERLLSTDNGRRARELLLGITQETNRSERDIHDVVALPGGLTSIHHQNVASDVIRGVRSEKHGSSF